MATAATKLPEERTTKIKIERAEDQPNSYDFEFRKWPFGTQKQKYENDDKPGFIIDFVIDDKDDTGLLFPKLKEQALWVHPVDHEDSPCPPRGAHWDEFQVLEVRDGGKTLRVRNRNSYYQLFKFSLNFTLERDKPDPELICWDPIGENRNGSMSRSWNEDLLVAGVLMGMGLAVAAFAAAGLRNGRRYKRAGLSFADAK